MTHLAFDSGFWFFLLSDNKLNRSKHVSDSFQGIHHRFGASVREAETSLSGQFVCPEGLWVQVLHWPRLCPAEGINTHSTAVKTSVCVSDILSNSVFCSLKRSDTELETKSERENLQQQRSDGNNLD